MMLSFCLCILRFETMFLKLFIIFGTIDRSNQARVHLYSLCSQSLKNCQIDTKSKGKFNSDDSPSPFMEHHDLRLK